MKLLLTYYKEHLPLVLLALILAATNITFSFLDPYFYRIIIDDYATKFKEYDTATFFRGITLLLAGIVGVAMISRIAKNFQDYFVNVIVQKVGSKIYTDGIRHTLQLPFQSFEDQRSGETLGILQKVRADIERLTNLFINIIFSAIVAITFVTIYAIKVYWVLAPFYLSTVPLIIGISFFLSTKIKKIQKSIVSETTSLAGSTTESLRNIELIKGLGLAQQEINRLNLNTDKILQLELKKVKYIRTLSFIQGTILNLIRTSLSFIMLYHIFKGHISVGEFFSLFLYSFYIFSPLQEVGTFINSYREAEISLENFEKLLKQPIEPKPLHPATITEVD
ncbi:MAG: ABC transporter ATP-binding protein, partial [Saprospiraceae bacterium]|nr:ABC transporter ATP-binding protein [Saprospiraceae bacterium]